MEWLAKYCTFSVSVHKGGLWILTKQSEWHLKRQSRPRLLVVSSFALVTLSCSVRSIAEFTFWERSWSDKSTWITSYWNKILQSEINFSSKPNVLDIDSKISFFRAISRRNNVMLSGNIGPGCLLGRLISALVTRFMKFKDNKATSETSCHNNF